MSWTNLKEALESGAANVNWVLEVDVTDPDAKLSNSGQWLRTQTLYFADKSYYRTNSVSSPKKRAHGQVLEWGSIMESGEFTESFSTTTDFQITLGPEPLQFQEPVSNIGGTVTALTPEPEAINLRFAELFRLWNWNNATCRLMLRANAGNDFHAGSSDTSVDVQEDTVATATIEAYSIEQGRVVLDCTMDTDFKTSAVIGRSLEDSPFQEYQESYAPVVYGEGGIYPWASNGAKPSTTLSFAWNLMGVPPVVSPCIPLEKTTPDSGITRLSYIFHDATNTNSISHTAPLGVGVLGGFWREDKGVWTQIVTGSSSNEAEATADLTSARYILNKYGYFQGQTYCAAKELVSGESNLTNPENCIDGDPATTATFDCGTVNNHVSFRLPSPGNIGSIFGTDKFYAFIVYDHSASTLSASSSIKWGLAASSGNGNDFYSGFNATTTTSGLGGTSNSYEIQTASASWLSSVNDGPMNWRWTKEGTTATTNDDLFFKILVTAGNAGDSIELHGVCVLIESYLFEFSKRFVVDYGERNRVNRYKGGENPTGRRIHDQRTPSQYVADQEDDGRPPSELWYGGTAAQMDDTSGTFTGSAGALIKNPIEQCHHMMRAWGIGITGSDIETATSTFGSFADAVGDLESWVSNFVTGGTEYNTHAYFHKIGLGDAIDTMTGNGPMFFHRSRIDGKFLCHVPTASGNPPPRKKMKDSGSVAVQYHPNYYFPQSTGSDFGKPYSATNLVVTSVNEDLRTSFKVKYGRNAATGEYKGTVYANQDEQKIWNETTGLHVTTSSGTLYDACVAAEDVLGHATEEVLISLPFVHEGSAATAYLAYIVTYGTSPRLNISFETGLESYDCEVGKSIQLSDDWNLVVPCPKYGADDWSDLHFIVKQVEIVPNARDGYNGGRVRIFAQEHIAL